MSPPTQLGDASTQREALADKLLYFNDEGSSFLQKAERLILDYKIATPSCTVTFKV